LSPVPSAGRPSRTARQMLLSFMDRTDLPSPVDCLKCASGRRPVQVPGIIWRLDRRV
jgi:hypothetical protein